MTISANEVKTNGIHNINRYLHLLILTSINLIDIILY